MARKAGSCDSSNESTEGIEVAHGLRQLLHLCKLENDPAKSEIPLSGDRGPVN